MSYQKEKRAGEQPAFFFGGVSMEDKFIYLPNGYFYVVAKLFDKTTQEHYIGWFVDLQKDEITWCELVYRNDKYVIEPARYEPAEFES